ncbi:MAG: guanylate kinase [Desulfovibrio sp.]|jgi:guanylate kinase|nr:guanylate kinase [Desulfovibrio sp.]
MVVCAPSGTGKTTLCKRLLEEFPRIVLSVSCTTRVPRPGEAGGRDYEFIDKEEFVQRRNAGFFAEWAEVHGKFYGTPLEPAWKLLSSGQDVLFDIDVQGASQIRSSLPGARLIFILPPSLHELERRLRARGTEKEEDLHIRLSAAVRELSQAHWFDAWIINQDLERAFRELCAAYIAATLAPARRPGFLAELFSGWNADAH